MVAILIVSSVLLATTPVDHGPVVVEIEFVPTAGRDLGVYPALRAPAFRLYDDGFLIYTEERSPWSIQVMAATLTAREKEAVVMRVRRGLDGIEAVTSSGLPRDSAELAIAVRTSPGTVREFRGHLRHVNRPDELGALVTFLESFTHSTGRPYRPTGGVVTRVLDWSPLTDEDLPSWPFAMGDCFERRVIVLTGWQMRELIETVGTNAGYHEFIADGRVHKFELVPWMPGEDPREDLKRSLGSRVCVLTEGKVTGP